MSNQLKDIAKRAESWPKEAQDELVRVAHEIEEAYVGSEPSAEDHEDRTRARAWAQLNRLFERMRALNPTLAHSPEEIRAEEEKITQDIRLMRRQQRHA